jgi:hypothetical protein
MPSRRLMPLALLAGLALGCASGPRSERLEDQVRDDPPRHSERPGPHSTTTGRHGTTGAPGGGIDAQSGPDEPTTPPSVAPAR